MMYSRRVVVTGNISLRDRDHGVMLNSTNDSDVTGNLVVGAAKCTFLYDANKNLTPATGSKAAASASTTPPVRRETR